MRVNSINTIYPDQINRRQITFKSSHNEGALSIQNPDTTQFKRNFQKTATSDAVQNWNFLEALTGKVRKAMKVAFHSQNDDMSDKSLGQLAYIRLNQL